MAEPQDVWEDIPENEWEDIEVEAGPVATKPAVQAGAPSPQWPGQARLTQADKDRAASTVAAVGAPLGAAATTMMVGPGVGRLVTAAAPYAKAAGAGALAGAPVGAVEGLFSGRGFVGGALHGAATGALYGAGLRGGAKMLRTALGRGAVKKAGGATTGAAKDALSKLSPNLAKSEAEWAARDQLLKQAKREASEAGTINAGRQMRTPIDELYDLFVR